MASNPVSLAFPADARAILHCPSPSVLTSGRAGRDRWVLEFAPRDRPFRDPLTGWIGGRDPLQQIRLRFPDRESALAYARRQGLPVTVHEPVRPRRIRREPEPRLALAA